MAVKYQAINQAHVDSAAELVLDAYREEKQAVPYLPDEHDFSEMLRERLTKLFSRGSGYAALAAGKFAGFLAGVEVPKLWGVSKGFYSPLYGHGAIKAQRASIYQGLYAHAAQSWVDKGLLSHAITLFAHDKLTMDTWFWLGFGGRCVDSLRRAAGIPVNPVPGVVIRKGEEGDIPGLKDIMTEFRMFWPQSPTFMLPRSGDPVEEYLDWYQGPDRYFWVACQNGIPVGQVRIEPSGESFISDHPKVRNVTSAFVTKAARSSGIGVMLLAAVQDWLVDNNYPLCGVDFESFNISGSRFWNKHFTPYTFSVARRIDR